MTLLLFSHDDCLDHDPGPGHPERAERVRVILNELRDARFERIEWREAPLVDLDDLRRVHPPDYVDAILKTVPESGW